MRWKRLGNSLCGLEHFERTRHALPASSNEAAAYNGVWR